ncbi:Aldehyde/histidinol dehydrogenase [Fusarium oxysporum]|nr:Aldehyde/histidinol dehydrogenase [Fusarium oxysporum]
MLKSLIRRTGHINQGALPLSRGHRSLSTNFSVPLIINGQQVHTSESFPVTSPLTNKEIWSFSCAKDEHIQKAVQSAHSAFKDWSKTKASSRRDIFLKAADIMDRRRAELGEYMHHEIGANKFYQDFILGVTIEGLRDTAGGIAGAMTGAAPESIHQVVLGIAPWNAPYNLGLRSVLFALATGNTTILKGSEYTPRCYWAIYDVLREAGLPDGCLNLLFHSPAEAASTIDSLVSHPLVKKINFTGSTGVGRIISATAGKHLKPVLMELGGKASAIVLKDANLEQAARHCVQGAFLNAGQICMSTERIIVHESIASEFQDLLGHVIRKNFGTAHDTPAVVTSASASRNRDLISDAISKGAHQVKIFGDEHAHETETKMRPVVLGNVKKNMDIYSQESFGPSVSLFTFQTHREALDLANDAEYGLTASIFSKDLKAAFDLANDLESGAVHINSMTVHDESSLPHGGVKDSGFGRFNGSQGLDEFLYYKTVTWME